jgi:hypothetical protein
MKKKKSSLIYIFRRANEKERVREKEREPL